MSYLGSWDINEYLTLSCVTKRPDSGSLNQADIAPQYLIYKDETVTPIVIGTYENFFASNPAFYKKRIQLTAASGFSQGSSYTIYTSGQVSGVAGAKIDNFQIKAATNAETTSLSGQINNAFNNALVGNYISGSINDKMYNLATTAQLSSSVWDEARSAHITVGTFGEGVASVKDDISNIIDGIWDELLADHTLSGSAGVKLNSLTSGGASLAASDVWNYATRTLSSFGFNVTVSTNNDKTGYSLVATPPTVTQIRQEIDSNSIQLNYLSGQTTTTNNRLTSTRAGYLDNLSAGAVALQSTLSSLNIPTSGDVANAVWAYSPKELTAFGFSVTVGANNDKTGYTLTVTPPTSTQIRQEIDSNSVMLSYISGEASALSNTTYGLSMIHSLVDDLENRLTAQRASYLDELGALNIPADIDSLLGRLTALRSSYLDYLSGGAVATHVDALNIRNDISAIPGTSGSATLANQESIINTLNQIKGTNYTSGVASLMALAGYTSGTSTVNVNSEDIWSFDTSSITDTAAIGNKIERTMKPIVRY